MRLRLLTYNIHKGFRAGNKSFVLPEIRSLIRSVGADLVFLQEVVGENIEQAAAVKGWPEVSQYEFLADEVWPEFSYGQNAVYEEGHHGNAILSRFPIEAWENTNISTNSQEHRGLLQTTIKIPTTGQTFHACCTHLDLTKRGQVKQVQHFSKLLNETVPPETPLILAGDFNDWTNHASDTLKDSLGLIEAVQTTHGKLRATFPAPFPVLRLDRIYVRGFTVIEATVMKEKIWRMLSDHVPVCATIELP